MMLVQKPGITELATAGHSGEEGEVQSSSSSSTDKSLKENRKYLLYVLLLNDVVVCRKYSSVLSAGHAPHY